MGTSSVIVPLLLAIWIPAITPQTSPQEKRTAVKEEREEAVRDTALRRALVWLEPSVPIEQAVLDANPPGGPALSASDTVSCRFIPEPVGGTTPKFDCELETGEEVRIKYGRDNPEVYAEVAASRLLSALGFPTDDVYVVARVHCIGCPPDPFAAFECLGKGGTRRACLSRHKDAVQEFEEAIIERRREGRRIETRKIKGWKWHELAKIDPAAGGATRAEVDALRLMAVFLSHWDNKPDNQRLMCLDDGCTRVVAMVHDLGGTFGPFKVELKGWAATPVWTEAASCLVSMRELPYGGSSFHDVHISEEGRAFLAARLGRLSEDQIRRLFTGSRVTQSPHDDPWAGDVANWVAAVLEKRRAIVDRPPCSPEAAEAP